MVKLGYICELIADGDWIESKDQANAGYRLIQTGNIGIGKFLDKSSKSKYISFETFDRLKCTEVFAGDILISRLPDPVGRACMVPANIGKAITAVDCTIIRLNNLCISNYFLNYTQSDRYYNELQTFLAGTTRTRISRKNLEKIEIPLPPIEEQRRIAATLDKVTDLIAKRRQQLDKLDELVKARFVEMFGDRVANNRNWNVKELRECATFHNGKAHEQVVNENGQYILVTSKFIASDQQEYRKTDDALFPLYQGDICMVMSDVPNGRALAKCVLIDQNNKYTLNQRICCFRNHKTNAIFLFYLLNRHEYFLSFDDGDSQTNLRKNDILSCPIILPPMELQNRFATFATQIDKLKATISHSLEKLEMLKKALMQEYFG